MKETVIISLGGSLIVPNEINISFLNEFHELILSELRTKKFVLCIGGGYTCRKYQKALSDCGINNNVEKDWIGIKSIMLNAQLIRAIFGENAYKEVIVNYNKKVSFEKILIVGALKPGCTSDFDAVALAKTYGSKKVINFTNVPYVYDKHPKEFKDAKPLKNLTWKEYLNIIGNKFVTGMHSPFDPVAAKLACKNKIHVEVLTGMANLKKAIEGKEFEGSSLF
jgi:uridylate kinase